MDDAQKRFGLCFFFTGGISPKSEIKKKKKKKKRK
jgi:hypothetical protein